MKEVIPNELKMGLPRVDVTVVTGGLLCSMGQQQPSTSFNPADGEDVAITLGRPRVMFDLPFPDSEVKA